MEKYLIVLETGDTVEYLKSPYSLLEETIKCAERLYGTDISYDVISGSGHLELWKTAKTIKSC